MIDKNLEIALQLKKENDSLRRKLKYRSAGADEALRAENRQLKANLANSMNSRKRLIAELRLLYTQMEKVKRNLEKGYVDTAINTCEYSLKNFDKARLYN